MNQKDAPIYEAITNYVKKQRIKFHVPGHNYGRGMSEELDFLGKLDITPMEPLDSLHDPQSCIKDAQKLAAECFGSKHTFFLVNGTTVGIEAVMLALCRDKVIVGRNMHKSVITGLVLSGAKPIFIQPEHHRKFNIPLNVTPESVESVIEKNEADVLITSPSQFGVCADIKSIAKIVHDHDRLLIVDEAWGSHLKFHKALPICSLDSGADIVIQSTHKRLGAISQASMLHLNNNSKELYSKLKGSLKMLQTTSSSYLILASLDLCRRQMALQGSKLFDAPIRLANDIREELSQRFSCLSSDNFNIDPTFITVHADGFAGWRILNDHNIEPEFATPETLTLITGIGNIFGEKAVLLKAFRDIPDVKHSDSISFYWGRTKISPRDAFLKDYRRVPLNSAVGKICAEIVCPYPPGIPALIPGEMITQNVVDYLKMIKDPCVVEADDQSLKTIKIVV